jgi:hypothetical protein
MGANCTEEYIKIFIKCTSSPLITAERVVVLRRIQEIPISNLGP